MKKKNFLVSVIIFFSLFSLSILANGTGKYPIYMFNGYDTPIVFNLTNTDKFESGELNKRGKILIGYASLQGNNLVVTDATPNHNIIPTLQVRASGAGSQWGLKSWTNLKSLFEGWRGTMAYAISQKPQEVDYFQINLRPEPSSRGVWQMSPTTPFEGVIEVYYKK